MTMSLYASTIGGQIPRLVASALRADSLLSGILTGVYRVGSRKLRGWQPTPPAVLVSAESLADSRQAGGAMYGPYQLSIVLLLAPEAAPNLVLAPPSPPGLAASSGTGPLTGLYHAALTAFSDSGESLIQEIGGELQFSSLTVSSKAIVVTPPALNGAAGFRYFRTEAGKTALKFHGVLNSAAEFTDSVADGDLQEELAPVQGFGICIRERIRQVLFANETLMEGGFAHAIAALKLADGPEELDPEHNLVRLPLVATYEVKYDRATRQNTANSA